MASASSRVGGLTAIIRAFVYVLIGSIGYAAYKVQWGVAIHSLMAGPGLTSRILLLLFVLFNWKNLPFAWTCRVFYAILYHNILFKPPPLSPKALFRPMISETWATVLEIDYNLHKSNSTFFTDLDVAHIHLLGYLMRPAVRSLAYNSRTGLVLDPRTDRPAKGPMRVVLGSVSCSFKKEIRAYKSYELWSKILTWDKKWLYIVTHFVPKGVAKPTEWLDPRFGRAQTRNGDEASRQWEDGIYATAVSRYVVKLGRFTVHPATVLENSGLLPERPAGWTSSEAEDDHDIVDLKNADSSEECDWDWKRVETQRRKGMKAAFHLAQMDECHDSFDGGRQGVLAKMGPC